MKTANVLLKHRINGFPPGTVKSFPLTIAVKLVEDEQGELTDDPETDYQMPGWMGDRPGDEEAARRADVDAENQRLRERLAEMEMMARIEAEADQPKRRGRPPKAREDDGQAATD